MSALFVAAFRSVDEQDWVDVAIVLAVIIGVIIIVSWWLNCQARRSADELRTKSGKRFVMEPTIVTPGDISPGTYNKGGDVVVTVSPTRN